MKQELAKYQSAVALPVRYDYSEDDGARILDSNNRAVVTSLGYGLLVPRHGSLEARRIRDAFGHRLAEAINSDGFFTENDFLIFQPDTPTEMSNTNP